MTIASQTSRISYTGDGSTTAFSVPFYWQANADIKVYLQNSSGTQTLQTLGTDYTLTGVGVSSGGTCTFTTAPTATTGAVIAIYRDPPVTQTTSYNNNDPFPAKSHENALDKLTTLVQRTRDLINRSFLIPDSDPVLDTHLPTAGTRKNKLLGFDSSGTPTAVNGPSFVGGTDIGAALVSTRAVAEVTTFAGSVIYLEVGGLTTVGDGGASTYKRGTGTGSFTDGGGVSWVPIIGGGINNTALGRAINGLIPANNVTTPNTKLDIAPGNARDSSLTADLILSTGVTKTTSAWAAGTGNGGLDTGSIAINTGYHIHLIYNTAAGLTDVLFSTSATAPSLPSGYTKRRRIGAFVTDASGFIYPGLWRADGSFSYTSPPTVASNRSLLLASLLTLPVPLGVKLKVKAFITATNAVDVGNPAFAGFFTDPDLGAPTAISQATFFKPLGLFYGVVIDAWTNTAGQVYTYSVNGNDADNTMSAIQQGWTDLRDEFS